MKLALKISKLFFVLCNCIFSTQYHNNELKLKKFKFNYEANNALSIFSEITKIDAILPKIFFLKILFSSNLIKWDVRNQFCLNKHFFVRVFFRFNHFTITYILSKIAFFSLLNFSFSVRTNRNYINIENKTKRRRIQLIHAFSIWLNENIINNNLDSFYDNNSFNNSFDSFYIFTFHVHLCLLQNVTFNSNNGVISKKNLSYGVVDRMNKLKPKSLNMLFFFEYANAYTLTIKFTKFTKFTKLIKFTKRGKLFRSKSKNFFRRFNRARVDFYVLSSPFSLVV